MGTGTAASPEAKRDRTCSFDAENDLPPRTTSPNPRYVHASKNPRLLPAKYLTPARHRLQISVALHHVLVSQASPAIDRLRIRHAAACSGNSYLRDGWNQGLLRVLPFIPASSDRQGNLLVRKPSCRPSTVPTHHDGHHEQGTTVQGSNRYGMSKRVEKRAKTPHHPNPCTNAPKKCSAGFRAGLGLARNGTFPVAAALYQRKHRSNSTTPGAARPGCKISGNTGPAAPHGVGFRPLRSSIPPVWGGCCRRWEAHPTPRPTKKVGGLRSSGRDTGDYRFLRQGSLNERRRPFWNATRDTTSHPSYRECPRQGSPRCRVGAVHIGWDDSDMSQKGVKRRISWDGSALPASISSFERHGTWKPSPPPLSITKATRDKVICTQGDRGDE